MHNHTCIAVFLFDSCFTSMQPYGYDRQALPLISLNSSAFERVAVNYTSPSLWQMQQQILRSLQRRNQISINR